MINAAPLELEREQTLLLDGPASVSLLRGRAEILGAELTSSTKITVRIGKRAPIEALEKAFLSVSLGKGAAYAKISGKAIPEVWSKESEKILSCGRATVVILGAGDSGKTTFSTYLANKAVGRERLVAIIDGDIGQASLGPPTTMSYTLIKTPVLDLFDVKPKESLFVGVISPANFTERITKGLHALRDDAISDNSDLIIIDTDGWIQAEPAKFYKIGVINETEPDFTVGLQLENELDPILNSISFSKVIRLPIAGAVKPRNREDRQLFREQNYSRYLKNSRRQLLELKEVKIELCHLGSGQIVSLERKTFLEKLIGCPIKHVEETLTSIFIVLDRRFGNLIHQIPKSFDGKGLRISFEGDEKGLLLGLLGSRREFLGLGVLLKIDSLKRSIQFTTPVKERIFVIQIGQVKLSEGKDIGTSGPIILS